MRRHVQTAIDHLRSGLASKDDFLKALASDSLLLRTNAVECLARQAFGRDAEFAEALAELVSGATADVVVLGSTRQKHYVTAQVLSHPVSYPAGLFESLCGALSADDITKVKALAGEMGSSEL